MGRNERFLAASTRRRTLLTTAFFAAISAKFLGIDTVLAQTVEQPSPLIGPKPPTFVEQRHRVPTIFLPQPVVDATPFAGCEIGARFWEGDATHYFPGDGCVGCSVNNLTAMQVPLNTVDLTIAFMQLPLESPVKITNLINGLSTLAKVTDRGGFEKYGFIADLGPAVKVAIDAGDITPIRITELLNCH